MERYVVHIYRRNPGDPKNIAGTVQCGGGRGRKWFLSTDALVAILASPERIPDKRAERPAKSGTGDELKSYSEIVESIRVEMEGQEF